MSVIRVHRGAIGPAHLVAYEAAAQAIEGEFLVLSVGKYHELAGQPPPLAWFGLGDLLALAFEPIARRLKLSRCSCRRRQAWLNRWAPLWKRAID